MYSIFCIIYLGDMVILAMLKFLVYLRQRGVKPFTMKHVEKYLIILNRNFLLYNKKIQTQMIENNFFNSFSNFLYCRNL